MSRKRTTPPAEKRERKPAESRTRKPAGKGERKTRSRAPKPPPKRERRTGGGSPRRAGSSAPKGRKRAAARAPRRIGARAWLGIAAIVALLLVPAVRTGVADGVRFVVAHLEAVRAAEARARVLANYQARYRIDAEMAAAVYAAAEAEGIPAELAFRLVRVESSFRERAVSPVGALGLTQLMPATAAELQPGITREQIFHRETNLRLGLRYFGQLLERYDGDVEEALHAYNRGMGTVARIRAAGGDPDNGYADAVLGERGGSPAE